MVKQFIVPVYGRPLECLPCLVLVLPNNLHPPKVLT